MDVWKLRLRIRADRDRHVVESRLRALGATVVWCQPSLHHGECEVLVDLAHRIDPPAAASVLVAADVAVLAMTRLEEARGAA